MSLWKKIAKNEIRIKTSRFRNHRRLFIVLIFSVCFYWGAFIGPYFMDAIIPEVVKEYSYQFETLIVQLIEFTFVSLFLVSLMYPLFVLFRKSEVINKEIILATPVKSVDIIFGEFIGHIPFYSLFILIVGPFGLTLILQINPNMNILHYLVYYLCIFTLYMFGSLIGKFISNWVEKVLGHKRVTDFSNFFLLLISIIVITIYYSFQFMFNFIKIHPEFKGIFLFYPSFWFSNIILYFVNFTLVGSYFPNIWISIILAITVPISISYFFYRKANFFCDLNILAEKDSKTINKENYFYNIIKKGTPRDFKGLVTIQFKVFLRKKENILKLVYMIGTISVLGVLIYISFKTQIFSLIIEPLNIPIIIQTRFDKNAIIFILSWMGGLIFGIFMGMHDFIGSKEILYVYKKSIRGTKALLYSLIYETLIILIFYAIFLTIFFSIIYQIDSVVSLLFFLTYIINSEIIFIQSIGIQCIRPIFGEYQKNLFINNYLIIFIQIVSFLLSLFIFLYSLSILLSPYLVLILTIVFNLGVSGLITFFIMYLGKKRLDKIE
ncbi:MAG: hypothetical protein ACFFCV_20710 [Promethearchaeota archaeon]